MQIDNEIRYVPGNTLRATIGTVLERVGCDWGDVEGLALAVSDSPDIPDGLLGAWDDDSNILRAVRPEAVAEVLDIEAAEPWGCDRAEAGHLHQAFHATVWLPDLIVQFAPRHWTGEYVGCDVAPKVAPAWSKVDLSERSPSPR